MEKNRPTIWFQSIFKEQRIDRILDITWYLTHMTVSSGSALTDLNINDSKRKTTNEIKRANKF